MILLYIHGCLSVVAAVCLLEYCEPNPRGTGQIILLIVLSLFWPIVLGIAFAEIWKNSDDLKRARAKEQTNRTELMSSILPAP